jgi:TonB family protein
VFQQPNSFDKFQFEIQYAMTMTMISSSAVNSGFATAPKPSLRLWSLAALGALVIHATAVALIVMQLDFSDPDDAFGSQAVEVGLDMLAPHDDETDLPPGPVSEAAAAAPAVVEQKATPDQSDLPKETPTETDDPDQLVSPNATKKPDDKDPVVKEVEAMPSTESIAAEATAPPPSDVAQESTRSVAPVQGSGQSAQKVMATYRKELVAYIGRHKRYPDGKGPRNTDIMVTFTMDRMGHVLSTSIIKSSGDPAFDEAALAMVRRSDPVPQPPPAVADNGLTFTMPVNFRAKK